MAGPRQRRKKMRAINTAFYLGRQLNTMWEIFDYLEMGAFGRLDRKLYRLRKRIIHWKG